MKKKVRIPNPPGTKKVIGMEVFVFLAVFFGLFVYMGTVMGAVNMLTTMMSTAYALLMEVVFWLMAIAVLVGAISGLFSEFGVISLLNKIFSPVVRVVYGLPGASAVGVFTTYLSDNPAILSLASDSGFRRYFKQYQLPALCNIGTAFGMGLIITTSMISMKSPSGEIFILAALVGNLGAVVGSIVSTRLMLLQTAKVYGKDAPCTIEEEENAIDTTAYRKVRAGGVGSRFLDAVLEGGKSGVQMGLDIIPGVLIICTIVMMLTNGPTDGVYTGAAYEGVGLLPMIGSKLSFLLDPLFGFQNTEAIGVPITALGAAGAALTLIRNLVENRLANAHDVAVFTAICMCWSGYLSTHAAMMDSLKCRFLTGKAILCHTIGGLCAGVFANWFYKLLMLIL